MLLNIIMSGLNNQSAKDLARLGVTPQMARSLVILLQHPRLRCSALARLLGLEATALSHLLRSLARKQLIVRNRVEKDNRAVEVHLTDKGKRIARACHQVVQMHESRMLQGFGAIDMRRLQQALYTIANNITPAERQLGGVVLAMNTRKTAKSLSNGGRERAGRAGRARATA